MFDVRVIPAAGQGGKGGGDEKRRSIPHKTDAPEESHRDLMHAWSIGVTSAARELVGQSAKSEETCPPEVYIG